MDEDFDISDFLIEEQNEKKYDIFYNSPVNNISIKFIFVKNNSIINIKKFKYTFNNPSYLSRNEFIKLLSKYRIFKSEVFSLYAILKFNYFFSHKDIISNNNNDFLTVVDSIEDIFFQNTIPIFDNINELFIILKPKTQSIGNTKKIKIVKNKKTRRQFII